MTEPRSQPPRLNGKGRTLGTTIEAPRTEAKPKPLGTVRIEGHYPLVALALNQILKGEADVYDGGEQPPGMAHPSCVILCPNGNDIASQVSHLRSSIPDAAVLVFEMRVDLRQSLKALRAGASGFLHAGMDPEQIVRAVRRASEGKAVISDEMLEKLIAQESATDHLTVLTPRQREILGLVVEGLSNAQIAQRLFLTESTVKQHLRMAYKLLKVRNRTEAARLLRAS